MNRKNKFTLASVLILGGICLTLTGCGWFGGGGDKNVAPGAKTGALTSPKDVKGQQVYLCDKTVSPYLLFRMLEKKTDLKVRDITIQNVSDEEIASTFLGNKNAKVAVTWNPMVLEILSKDKSAKKIFDSSEIPGEIQDLCVVNTKALKENPDFARALVGAWYETLSVMNQKGQAGEDALKKMAQLSGPTTTVDLYKAQLKTTAMYWTPAEAVAFTKSKDLQSKNDIVRKFCFTYGLLGETAKSADVVGIQYPDGTIQGDAGNVKFRYVTDFMEEQGAGKIVATGSDRSGAARKKFKLAISVYAGWMPWYYAQETGILKKWADRYGIEIEVVRASYGGTLDAFVANQVDACLMTNMDCFFTPANAGIDCSAIIMGDYSNGNDAVIVR